jgi:hypothetical protein
MSVQERHGVRTINESNISLYEQPGHIVMAAFERDTVSKSASVRLTADEASYLATKLHRLARRLRERETSVAIRRDPSLASIPATKRSGV